MLNRDSWGRAAAQHRAPSGRPQIRKLFEPRNPQGPGSPIYRFVEIASPWGPAVSGSPNLWVRKSRAFKLSPGFLSQSSSAGPTLTLRHPAEKERVRDKTNGSVSLRIHKLRISESEFIGNPPMHLGVPLLTRIRLGQIPEKHKILAFLDRPQVSGHAGAGAGKLDPSLAVAWGADHLAAAPPLYIYIYIYICMYVYVYIYIYIYACAHTVS